MASKTVAGADARLNSSPVTPPAGDADHRGAEGSRAWLNGIAWLNGLTEPERAAVLGVFEVPKVAATAQADRGEALAQELTPEAPKGKFQSFETDEERLLLALEATWQLEPVMDAIIEATDKGGSSDLLCKSLAIRGRALVCAAMSAIDDPGHETAEIYLTVHGVPRAAEGAAS